MLTMKTQEGTRKKVKNRIFYSKIEFIIIFMWSESLPKIHIRVTHNFTVSPTLFLTNCVNTQNDFCDMFFLSD